MDRISALMALVLSTSAFAYPGEDCSVKKQNAIQIQEMGCLPKKSNQIPFWELYDHQGINLGVRADVLYMNYTVPNLSFAFSESRLDALITETNYELPGKMSVGCNIAINYTMQDQPGYSFESSWYHIVAQFNNQVPQTVLLFPIATPISTSEPQNIFALAHLTLNFFDLLIQKNFGWGDRFSIIPSAGLAGGTMNWTSGYTNAFFDFGPRIPQISVFNLSSSFKGIGIKIGGRTSYAIGRGFKLTADLFYSVLYGFTKTHSAQSRAFFSERSAKGFFKNHHGRSFFDSLIGFAWESRFRNDSLFLELHAGWKFQSFSDGLVNGVVELDPLYGQGLQSGATFKF